MPFAMRLPVLTDASAFRALAVHYADAKEWQMRALFSQQPDRFERCSLEAAGLFLDYSKNLVNERTMQLLMQLARERGIEQRRDAMFAGEGINVTEHRPVLHTALRLPRDSTLLVDGQDVVQEVHAVLDRIK
ncbi:MAG: glucose-6-phosphate isomerase, partial [Noviherbaspirillum sp.]